MNLTPRQSAVLSVICDYRHRHGYAPTIREIADAAGVSKVTVFDHVDVMERKGIIRRTKHAARSIEIVKDVPRAKVSLRFPVLGTIARDGIKEAAQ